MSLKTIAAAHGWRHEGSSSMAGRLGSIDWRGGTGEDEQQRWTEFEARVMALSPGGFVIISRSEYQQSLQARERRDTLAAAGLPRLLWQANRWMEALFGRLTGGLSEGPVDEGPEDRNTWRVQPAGSAGFQREWVMLCSEPRWLGVITPGIEALWWQCVAPDHASLHAHGQHHRLRLCRIDRTIPPPQRIEALLVLGEAMLESIGRIAGEAGSEARRSG